jgi:alpha-ribazole phosphatase/probable phosphoglycerate mutase
MKWYFVRHGEIESNIRKIYAGWSGERLTENGIQQAGDAGLNLKDCAIDAIYCSPLNRTIQTAEIIGDILNKKPILDESFKELRLGVWEGLSEEIVARNYPREWEIWNTKPADLILEGRETLHELLERALGGIKRIQHKFDWKNVVVVTHVAIIRVLLLYVQHLDLNLYKTIPVPKNGKVFHLCG